jgi:ribosomal protein S20
MPLLKHAKKKLKQDKKRAVLNKKVKNTFKAVVKKAKETKSEKTLSAAFKGIDKAVKKNIIHKNQRQQKPNQHQNLKQLKLLLNLNLSQKNPLLKNPNKNSFLFSLSKYASIKLCHTYKT